jgi:hypothetical protein
MSPRYLALIVLVMVGVLILQGCASTPKAISRAELEAYAAEHGMDAPVGDGVTVGEALDLDMQRHIQAIEMFEIMNATEAYVVEQSMSPLKYPTVSVKYTGEPTKDIFNDSPLIMEYLEMRRVENDTIFYSNDLAAMTITLERLEEGMPYEYRELSSTVPYGYCLDFIVENLGKPSEDPEGFVLLKIVCSQDDLGIQY